ncbi:MAG TPA: hypothetical protein VNH11_15245 [Pirellulales bacterium]|nr:hypothetical protein [Pirellulales bacterium]
MFAPIARLDERVPVPCRAHFRLLSAGCIAFVRQATVRPELPPSERAAG